MIESEKRQKTDNGSTIWFAKTSERRSMTSQTFSLERIGTPTGPMVYQSDVWEHPPTLFWESTPFFKFQNPTLSWTCMYNNTGDNAANTIYSGQSSVTDEMCVTAGFYFPATNPLACIWDTTIPGGCSCSTTGG